MRVLVKSLTKKTRVSSLINVSSSVVANRSQRICDVVWTHWSWETKVPKALYAHPYEILLIVLIYGIF